MVILVSEEERVARNSGGLGPGFELMFLSQHDGLLTVESGTRYEHQSHSVRLTFLGAAEWQLQPKLSAKIAGHYGIV